MPRFCTTLRKLGGIKPFVVRIPSSCHICTEIDGFSRRISSNCVGLNPMLGATICMKIAVVCQIDYQCDVADQSSASVWLCEPFVCMDGSVQRTCHDLPSRLSCTKCEEFPMPTRSLGQVGIVGSVCLHTTSKFWRKCILFAGLTCLPVQCCSPPIGPWLAWLHAPQSACKSSICTCMTITL